MSEATGHEMAEPGAVVWLDPADLVFERSPGGVLRLTMPDRCHRDVQVLRAMPLARPDDYLSVRCGDDEVGVLRTLADLAPEQRALVAAALDEHYFRPRITGVRGLRESGGSWSWQVDTDRGAVKFVTRHPRQAVTRLEGDRWLLLDADNNRYLVADIAAMDRLSRKLLERALG
jgi:hypothetical protein